MSCAYFPDLRSSYLVSSEFNTWSNVLFLTGADDEPTESDMDRIPDFEDAETLTNDEGDDAAAAHTVTSASQELAIAAEVNADERLRSLAVDPDLEELEDNTYEWRSVVWDQDMILIQRQDVHRLLPSEDVQRVCAIQCGICTVDIQCAVTLSCRHMLCLNCSERLKLCPWCQRPLKVESYSNLASLDIGRIAPLPGLVHAQPTAPSPSTIEANQSDRNREAISEVLREEGIEDPEAYIAELRQQGRQQRPRTSRRYVIPGDEDQNEGQDDPSRRPSQASSGRQGEMLSSSQPPLSTQEASLRRQLSAEAALRRSAASTSSQSVPPAAPPAPPAATPAPPAPSTEPSARPAAQPALSTAPPARPATPWARPTAPPARPAATPDPPTASPARPAAPPSLPTAPPVTQTTPPADGRDEYDAMVEDAAPFPTLRSCRADTGDIFLFTLCDP